MQPPRADRRRCAPLTSRLQPSPSPNRGLAVDSLDVTAAMIQAARETVGGVRLDTYVKLELRVGRPSWAREEQP